MTITKVDAFQVANYAVYLPGDIIPNLRTFVRNGFLACEGVNQTRATYSELFKNWGCVYGIGDGTEYTASSFSILSDICTITYNSHGLNNGDLVAVRFLSGGKWYNRGVEVENALTNTFDFDITDWEADPEGTVYFIIGTTFGIWNGKGQFLRGWDNGAGVDPDASGRTDRGDGVTGDQIGTNQLDNYKSHDHTRRVERQGSHAPSSFWRIEGQQILDSSSVSAEDDTGVSGGNETRAKNTSAQWIVKY